MKASKALINGIKRVEKKYGEMTDKEFCVEPLEENRRGGGYYDYCEMYDRILNIKIIVSHDGKITEM